MADRPPIYVGYMSMPLGVRRAVRAALLTLVIVMVGSAALIASGQRDPGPAVWDTSSVRSWTGTLVDVPYPMLLTDEGEALLIVEIGKLGAQDRVEPLASTSGVTVTGYPMERDGRKMIELIEGEEALEVTAPDARRRPLSSVPGAPVEVVGEIVDGKCFLGAMKPGEGKAHKSCAVLCIAGGLPPMVLTRDASGTPTFHLLVVDGRAELPFEAWDLVAEPVRLEGRLGRIGDLSVLSCAGPECIAPAAR